MFPLPIVSLRFRAKRLMGPVNQIYQLAIEARGTHTAVDDCDL